MELRQKRQIFPLSMKIKTNDYISHESFSFKICFSFWKTKSLLRIKYNIDINFYAHIYEKSRKYVSIIELNSILLREKALRFSFFGDYVVWKDKSNNITFIMIENY